VEDEIARVETSFNGDLVDQIADLGSRDPVNPKGCLLCAHSQRLSDLLSKHPACSARIQLHRAAEKRTGIHVADEHEHVGQRRFSPAQAIADRSG